MISNNTTNLDTKSSYTSLDKPVKPKENQAVSADSANVAEAKVSNTEVSRTQAAAVETPEQSKEKQSYLDEVSRKVTEVIPKVRELLQKNQSSLDFQVAEHDNRVIITVIDKETDKVIRQIPPEDLIHVSEAIDQGIENNLAGIIFNSKA